MREAKQVCEGQRQRAKLRRGTRKLPLNREGRREAWKERKKKRKGLGEGKGKMVRMKGRKCVKDEWERHK